jgi:type IV pilus assembly protein PilC
MSAVAKKDTKDVKLYNYSWSGKDKTGKIIKGEMRAGGEHVVMATLRRQGVQVGNVKKVSQRGGCRRSTSWARGTRTRRWASS